MASPFNPYQAPQADALPPIASGDFDIGQAITDGYKRTVQYLWPAVGISLLGSLLCFLATITIVGYFLAVPVFAWGMLKFFVNMQDERADLNDLFAGFSNYGTVLGRSILLMLLLIGMTLVGESVMLAGQFMKSVSVQLIGTLIYLLFFVLVLSRLYFAFFFLVDKDMSATEALAASWRATEGKTFKLLGLAIISGLVGASGVLALCVGLLFTIPMSYAMYASAYRQVVPHGPPARGGWAG